MTDEIVYVVENTDRQSLGRGDKANSDSVSRHLQSYLDGKLWIEVVFQAFKNSLRKEDERAFVALFESNRRKKTLITPARMSDNPFRIDGVQKPVFIGVGKLLQEQEQLQFRPLPSVIWLQGFDNVTLPSGDVLNVILPAGDIHSTGRGIWKLNDSFIDSLPSVEPSNHRWERQLPDGIVEGSAQIDHDVPNNTAPVGRKFLDAVYAVLSSQTAFLFGDFERGGWAFKVAFDPSIKRLQVRLRPFDFVPRIVQGVHDENLTPVDAPMKPASRSETDSNAE